MSTSSDALKAALADRYTLEREVGAGGMATVYLAHDFRHNRKVAIKVMHPDLADLTGRTLGRVRQAGQAQEGLGGRRAAGRP